MYNVILSNIPRKTMVTEKDKYSSHRWIGCPTELEYFGEERKAGKQQRKMATAKDRSKYKKTDQAKIQSKNKDPIARENLFRGRVLATTSEGFTVEENGATYACTLRGALKKERGQAKNLVTVGDIVFFDKITGNEGIIAFVEPRRTVLSRSDNLSRRKEQLIAANIDQVIIMGSVIAPRLKAPLLDRYVIAAKKGGLTPLIVINKMDLLDDPSFDEGLRQEERELCEHLVGAYAEAGIPMLLLSTTNNVGVEELLQELQGKASVVSGQSGVGKSSLINAITGGSLRIGDVVKRTSKGSHTTTSASLLPLTGGGWCIDTPGIKSFGVWDLKKDEVESYFAEIHALGRTCHYPDCIHLHEGGCAVVEAVEEGRISLVRYLSYHTLLEGVSQLHKRR